MGTGKWFWCCWPDDALRVSPDAPLKYESITAHSCYTFGRADEEVRSTLESVLFRKASEMGLTIGLPKYECSDLLESEKIGDLWDRQLTATAEVVGLLPDDREAPPPEHMGKG